MERLKWLRKSRGISQEKLGEMLGVQKAAVSKYEKGIVIPSPEVLKKLSGTFGVSIDYLLENDRMLSATSLPKDETQLLELFRQLPEKARQALLAVAHQMAPST